MLEAGLLLAIVAALASCAGGEDAPLGTYGQTCDASHACVEGLECSLGVCTARCSNSAMCQMLGTGDTCTGGSCFTSCRDTFNCPSGLTCTMVGTTMGTCRP